MQGANRAGAFPTPHPGHVCARRLWWAGPDCLRPRPSFRETPRPCGWGLRSGLWLRPRCSSGGGGRGQRGSFPCCVCRCLLAILLQSLFLSAGLPGAAGREALEEKKRGRRRREAVPPFFFFCIKFLKICKLYFANILGDIDFSPSAFPFFPVECAALPSPVVPRR